MEIIVVPAVADSRPICTVSALYGEETTMNANNDPVYLPLSKALLYLDENGLSSIKDMMEEVSRKFGGQEGRNIRKGIFVTELERLGKLSDFCEQHWKNGSSRKGVRLIRRYKSCLSELDTFVADDVDEDEFGSMPEQGASIEQSRFAYEDDLRDYLASNLSLIEPGLTLFRDDKGIEGVEYAIDETNKRVDILAVDREGTPVVIELKVSRGYERVLGQCQYYKNRLKERMTATKVRVIIVAREITKHLRTACMDLPDFELFEYSLSIELKRVVTNFWEEEIRDEP